LRVVVLSGWLHDRLGVSLAQTLDIFNYHLHFPLNPEAVRKIGS
jgi:hypothetical protein